MTKPSVTVGHRGWPVRFPDNTLAGFLAASSVVDEVELDVRRSGDGKLVLSHDPNLVGLAVHENPWSILAELDLGDGHHPALLDEVLAALPDTRVQLEIKNDSSEPGFEPDHRRGLEAAERSRPGDMVTSFNPATLEAVRRIFPNVSTGLLVTGAGVLDDFVKYCLDAGHRSLVPDHRMIHGPVSADAGVAIGTWTVDDPVRAAELVEWGVSSIITNDPGLISQHLEDSA